MVSQRWRGSTENQPREYVVFVLRRRPGGGPHPRLRDSRENQESEIARRLDAAALLPLRAAETGIRARGCGSRGFRSSRSGFERHLHSLHQRKGSDPIRQILCVRRDRGDGKGGFEQALDRGGSKEG